MDEPSGKGFQEVVLFHLAGLRAEIYQVKRRLASMRAAENGKSEEELRDLFGQETNELHQKLYYDALKEAGLR